MDQEITVSESIVDLIFYSKSKENRQGFYSTDRSWEEFLTFIGQNIRILDRGKLPFIKSLERLEQICDKEDYNYFFTKQTINEIYDKKIKIIDINLKENDLFKLAMFTNDKIFVNIQLTDDELMSLKSNESGVEVHNKRSFIKPLAADRIKHIPTEIECQENITYNLELILYPFLRNASEITIDDPYIRNYLGTFNLSKILKNCVNLSKIPNIAIKVFPDEIYENPHGSKHLNNSFFEKIVDKYKIKIEFYTTREILKEHESKKVSHHIERYINTDKFKIRLPGGLDQFDKDGKINCKDNRKEISISLL